MQVSLNISKATLEALRTTLRSDLMVLEASAQELRDNISRIDRALGPVTSWIMVTSESDPQRSYKVTMTYTTDDRKTYLCSCPSFHSASGLDDRSRCKHIRVAQNRGL